MGIVSDGLFDSRIGTMRMVTSDMGFAAKRSGFWPFARNHTIRSVNGRYHQQHPLLANNDGLPVLHH